MKNWENYITSCKIDLVDQSEEEVGADKKGPYTLTEKWIQLSR